VPYEALSLIKRPDGSSSTVRTSFILARSDTRIQLWYLHKNYNDHSGIKVRHSDSFLKPVLWIGLDPDSIGSLDSYPDLDPGGQKWTTTIERVNKIHFWCAGCSLLRLEGFSCSLDFLYGGIGIKKKISALVLFINFRSSDDFLLQLWWCCSCTVGTCICLQFWYVHEP
jgi:hypothetical protein